MSEKAVCEACILSVTRLGTVNECTDCGGLFTLIDPNRISSYLLGSIHSDDDYFHPYLGQVLVLPVKKLNSNILYHGTYIEYVYNIYLKGFLSKAETRIRTNGFLSEKWLRYLTASRDLASEHPKDGVILEFNLSGHVVESKFQTVAEQLIGALEQLDDSFIGLEYLESGKKSYALCKQTKIRPAINKYNLRLLKTSLWLRFLWRLRKLKSVVIPVLIVIIYIAY